MAQTLYTIGHSTQPIEKFTALLRANEITAVYDVRSHPYSRFNPQYNRESLQAALRTCGIAYVYMGRELGARSEDPGCYHLGKVVYGRLAETSQFRNGLDRLRREIGAGTIALMCAEKDPITCHRTILVGRNMRAPGLNIVHILDSGALETNEQAETRLKLSVGITEPDLFESPDEQTERAYELQGRKIAYSGRFGSQSGDDDG